MEITTPSTASQPQHVYPTKKSALIFFTVLAIVVGTIIISFLQLQSPRVIPKTGASNVFSAERAFSYLEEFAVAPHPLGSTEHDRVRDYLVQELKDLGLSPEIQNVNSLRNTRTWVTGGNIENIIAKIDGTSSSKAVMLVAHYDSVPGGPGVADDGAGIAGILETIRALKEHKALKNDVIILLTDGEENGLLGAKAFVEEHPWVQNVGLVLNFEARGNEGPAFMFETSEDNSWIIQEFVKAAPTPVAHSFIYNLYKLMPNDTDLTVFKEAGLNGLNFAFGEGLGHYHTTSDNLEKLSKESLQHHGEYMLSLLLHFGQLDLAQEKEGNRIFFNIFGATMTTYSDNLVLPIMGLAVLLFAFTMVHGLKRKQVTVLGTLAGFLTFLVSMVGSAIIGFSLWKVLTIVFSNTKWMLGTDITFGTLFLISFSIIIISFLNLLYHFVSKKIKVGNLTMGALLIWLILTVVTSFLLIAGSYVFSWPLLFALIGVNLYFRSEDNSWKGHLLSAGFAIPGLLIVVPVIYLVQMLVSMSLAPLLMVLVCLLGGLFVPFLTTLTIKYKWVMPTTLLGVGLVVLLANCIFIANAPSEDHHKASDITYFMDADKGKAYWAARHALDGYTSQYVNGDVKIGNTSEFFPMLQWDVNYAEADLYNIEGPIMNVLSDETVGNKRTIEYHLKTNRKAEEMFLQSVTVLNMSQLSINGKDIELSRNTFTKENPFLFTYIVGQTGEMNVKITVNANDKIEWIVADRAYSLPDTKGKRPSEYSTYGDNSFVMRTIKH
ncbi:M20/M25/M40 family metallo-hydrolase [Peribacillus acanthi]|uniref:M20/M25/M40 family metallo-hydrolase n=1 Tax=Peribacillus acanthi TaxID=2171554 RepID=UPI000D3EDBC5|nr:M20/M25/M40 family metallo-hydrolase [Peribacillus acanthi]